MKSPSKIRSYSRKPSNPILRPKSLPKREAKKRVSSPLNKTLTPISKQILKGCTDNESREKLKRILFLDSEMTDDYIDDVVDKSFQNKHTVQDIGRKMEDFICAYAKCPYCESPFQKFLNPNTPMADVICNDGHMFQIKSSGCPNQKYFSSNKITVGSKRYSEYLAKIADSNSEDLKKNLVGFILCFYQRKSENEIRLRENGSYCILPNLDAKTGETYYTYEENGPFFGKGSIIPNKNNTNIFKINKVIAKKNFSLDEEFS